MSLAIGVVQKDFIITTSDTAVTYFPIDEEIYEETGQEVPTGEMIASDIKSEKTYKISDNVILIATGTSALTETLMVEISEQVSNNTSFQKTRKISKTVLENFKKEKVNNIDKILSNLQADLPLSSDLDSLKNEYWGSVELIFENDPRNLTAYLVGFNPDGSSGMYDIIGDNYVECPKNENKGYPIAIAGHIDTQEGQSLYKNTLTLPVGQRTIDKFIKGMSNIHAHSSFINNITISKDCNFRILKRYNGQVKYSELSIDTSTLYESLGLKEESQ